MRNVDVFFRVLERFNDFESKKYGYIKNVEIIVFKNEKGYNIYFGLRNNDCLFFGEQVVRGEQNFVHNGINKAFLPNTGVYLENGSEEELDTILFVFNKKYSATLGFFDSLKKIYNKSKIDTFSTSPELELYTTIWIDKNNSPLNINKHLLGSKDAYSKIMLKTAAIRKSEIWYNAKVIVEICRNRRMLPGVSVNLKESECTNETFLFPVVSDPASGQPDPRIRSGGGEGGHDRQRGGDRFYHPV